MEEKWWKNPTWISVIIALAAIGLSVYTYIVAIDQTFNLSIEPMEGEIYVSSLQPVQDTEPLTAAVNVEYVNGYEHSVSLVVMDKPPGINIDFSLPGASQSSFISYMTIGISPDVATGEYVIPLTGIGGDGQQKSCCFVLNVDVPAKPDIKITEPWDGSVVAMRETLTGTCQNIPEGSVVWPVVYPKESTRYFPDETPAIMDKEDEWTSDISIGVDADYGRMYKIIGVLADKNTQAAFEDYHNKCIKENSWPGMEALPEGAQELCHVTVSRQMLPAVLPPTTTPPTTTLPTTTPPTTTPTTPPTTTPPTPTTGPIVTPPDEPVTTPGTGTTPAPPPIIEITVPADGSNVTMNQNLLGKAQNIPEGYQLWAMVKPGEINRYYPQDEPIISDAFGNWAKQITIGSIADGGKPFDIIVVLADPTAQKAFTDYCESSNKTGSWLGLEALPTGLAESRSITVIRE